MAGKSTIVHALEQNAKYIPSALAIQQGRRAISFHQLNTRANKLGSSLLSLGIQRGERIALGLTNSIEFIESTYGIWKCACVSVPLNYRFMDAELIHVLNNSDSVGAIIEATFLETFLRIKPQLPQLGFLLVVGDIDSKPSKQVFNYAHTLAKHSTEKPRLPWNEQSDNDIGYNIYTGGTTGMPKGISYNEKAMTASTLEAFSASAPALLKEISQAGEAMLLPVPGGRFLNSRLGRKIVGARLTGTLARKLLANASTSYKAFIAKKMSGKLKILIVSPMMRSLGWVLAFTLPKMGGAIYLLEDKSYHPSEALRLIEENQINILGAIGDATLKPMLAELDSRNYDISCLQGIFASGMPTSAEVKRNLLKKHMPNTRFMDFIGGSELTGMAFKFYTANDTEFDKACFPVTDLVKIINSDTGKTVQPGEVGELARRTNNLPNGYYNDPEKTAKLIRSFNGETWLMSGDLAQLNSNGTFQFVGRGSECINTGGEKVYPEEVENLLIGMDGIKTVGLTATPDATWGELVTAVVELEPGATLSEAAIISYTEAKIAGYKRPKRVIFTDDFPTTLIGKPHYKALRELAKSTLQQENNVPQEVT